MRSLLLIVVAFVFPMMAHGDFDSEQVQPSRERRVLICDQLSDSRCFGRVVNSICIVDAQKGQAGFCRARTNRFDSELVTCWCR